MAQKIRFSYSKSSAITFFSLVLGAHTVRENTTLSQQIHLFFWLCWPKLQYHNIQKHFFCILYRYITFNSWVCLDFECTSTRICWPVFLWLRWDTNVNYENLLLGGYINKQLAPPPPSDLNLSWNRWRWKKFATSSVKALLVLLFLTSKRIFCDRFYFISESGDLWILIVDSRVCSWRMEHHPVQD